MSPLRSRALKLRLEGQSYNEINAALGIPKSTLSGWFRHLVLQDVARARLTSRTLQGTRNAFLKRNKLQTKEAEARARRNRLFGKSEIPLLSEQELKIVGATLYWAEGHKKMHVREGKERMWHTISFVNSDASMIRVFIRFLKETLSIPEESIRLSMRLYPHINEAEAKKHWADASGIASPRFFKTTYLVSGASKGSRPYTRLPWGTLQVEVCDTAKFHRLLGLIDGVKSGLQYDRMPALPG